MVMCVALLTLPTVLPTVLYYSTYYLLTYYLIPQSTVYNSSDRVHSSRPHRHTETTAPYTVHSSSTVVHQYSSTVHTTARTHQYTVDRRVQHRSTSIVPARQPERHQPDGRRTPETPDTTRLFITLAVWLALLINVHGS
jgi:hypothetical protein